MTDLTSTETKPKGRAAAERAMRPRSNRYNGRVPREILILDEKDEWITAQMGKKWSRNQVIDQCIGIAMNKVDVASRQEEAVAATMAAMQKDIDALAGQLRTVLAILTVDTKLRYATSESVQPKTFDQHRALVQEMVQALKGAKS